VGVNASWEQGTSSSWYIELQRLGGTDIVSGIETENDSLIRQGIHILDWGFAHEAADGSYPGTGDAFHSAAIFVEAAANATLLLKQYHPSTYTADTAYYTSVANSYTQKLHLSAAWMTIPSVASQGQSFDQPYTHRRYLLAAALGQVATLSQDTALAAAASTYASNGIALQMTGGTFQIPYPDGTVHNVSATGVNPELGGYDVSYQCAGILYAEHFYNTCSNNSLKNSLKSMMNSGLTWESGRISTAGILDTVGSTRIGVEQNRDGTVKTANAQEIISALSGGYTITGLKRSIVTAYRYIYAGRAVTSDSVAADGAVNGNANWENGTASTWSIAQQRIGADYIEQGILCENDSLIRKGILISNWGWNHQIADGSFGTTSTPYFAPSQFIEAAARSANLLRLYQPVTYTADLAYFNSTASTFATKCNLTGGWLTTATNWPIVQHNCATSTCRQFALAGGLAATAASAGNSALFPYAGQAAQAALAMQGSNGMDPENGLADVNNQALGLVYASRYITNAPAGAIPTQTAAGLALGLNWELSFIQMDGSVTGTTSPATKTIDTALKLGNSILGDPIYIVYRERMNLPEMQLYQ